MLQFNQKETTLLSHMENFEHLSRIQRFLLHIILLVLEFVASQEFFVQELGFFSLLEELKNFCHQMKKLTCMG